MLIMKLSIRILTPLETETLENHKHNLGQQLWQIWYHKLLQQEERARGSSFDLIITADISITNAAIKMQKSAMQMGKAHQNRWLSLNQTKCDTQKPLNRIRIDFLPTEFDFSQRPIDRDHKIEAGTRTSATRTFLKLNESNERDESDDRRRSGGGEG